MHLRNCQENSHLDQTVVDISFSFNMSHHHCLTEVEFEEELKKLVEEIVNFTDCRPNSADLSCVSDNSLISESPCRKKLNLTDDLGYESPEMTRYE